MDMLRVRSHWAAPFEAASHVDNRPSRTSRVMVALFYVVRNSTIARGVMGFCQVMVVVVVAAAAQQWSSPYADGRGQEFCSSKDAVSALEAPYLIENEAAMKKMMSDMAIKPTGDIDRDFVSMMSPHHQGAIAMAKSVLRYGRNLQIRRLAQEIIVTQQQEIIAMRLALGDPPSASASKPSPVQLLWYSRRP